MKKLIYILVLSLFVFNCSKDDDENTNTTFLEKYENTVWYSSENDAPSYIRFINNENNPLEYWIDLDDCYNYYLDTFYEGDTISKNSNDTLEFTYLESDGGVEYKDIITLTVSGNSIEVKFKYYENNELYESGTQNFTKSSIDVDSFNLCD
jgi:hypothetical protein